MDLQKICEIYNITVLTEENLKELYRKGRLEADYIFSFYWKRIGKEILAIPQKGSINFHPGPLPEARGSGYHMAILENWGYYGVTAHYMDEEFDTGELIKCRHFSIAPNIINHELVKLTHENLFLLFQDIVKKIFEGETLEGIPQTEERYFSLSKLESSKKILEEDTEQQIERKIRAFWNPPYDGARININGKWYTVIDKEILR